MNLRVDLWTARARKPLATDNLFKLPGSAPVVCEHDAVRQVVVDVLPRPAVEQSVTACESFQFVAREVGDDEAVGVTCRLTSCATPTNRR